MTGKAALLVAEIGAPRLALLAGVAFVAATVSGMSGVGGPLLAIFIAPVVGVKAVVPTVGIATPKHARQHAPWPVRGAPVHPQKPHEQDELYVVVPAPSYTAASAPSGPGDALFVAAGIEHRFEDFSDDFATWAVLRGPGGRRAGIGALRG